MNVSGISQISSALSAQNVSKTHEVTMTNKALDQQVANGVASLKLIQSASIPQTNGRVGNNLNVVA